MGTLSDEDLRHLLGEAAGAYDVPEDGPDEVLAAAAVPVVPQRRRFVQLVAAAAVVAVGGVLAVQVVRGDAPAQVQPAAAPAVVQQNGPEGVARLSADESAATGGGTTAGGGDTVTYTAMQPQAAAPLAGTKAAAPPATAPTATDGARIVKKGAVALVVENGRVTPTLTAVQELARANGGDVASGSTQELGPTPSGKVVLRVPVGAFEQVVAAVRSLDAEIASATTSGQDVTAQYADLEAQLRTLRAARERFLEILSRTRTVGDTLAVQQRVDDVTGQIDRIEGQRRVLADQSDRATLEVTVSERDDPAVVRTAPDDGLGTAFRDAWDGFTSGVEGLVRLSGRGVLLLMCLAVAAVVLRLGWRLTRRRLV